MAKDAVLREVRSIITDVMALCQAYAVKSWWKRVFNNRAYFKAFEDLKTRLDAAVADLTLSKVLDMSDDAANWVSAKHYDKSHIKEALVGLQDQMVAGHERLEEKMDIILGKLDAAGRR